MLVDGVVRDNLPLDTYSGDDDGARLNQVSELMHAHGIYSAECAATGVWLKGP